MRIKKLLIIIPILVILIILGMYPIINKKHLSYSNTNTNTLKLYVLGQHGHIDERLQAIIDEFQNKYPSIKIKTVLFDNSTNNGISKYQETLLSDTLSGDGPDILYLNSSDTLILEKSGMLENLKPFLDKDKTFKKEDYNTKVIEAGVYNGEQLVMPLDYYVNQYTTTKELLENNNIHIKDNSSENEFMNSINSYILSSSDANKTLFAAPMNIEDFLASTGENFIDYENKDVYFNTTAFKQIINNYKKIYNASKKESGISGFSGSEGFEALKDGTSLFSNDPIERVSYFLASESLLNEVTGETQVINNIPTYKGGKGVAAIVGSSMAISKNSKNKEAAYNFLKIALSEKIQASNLPSNIPVNKKAAEDLENQYMTNEVGKSYAYDKSTTIIQQRLSENFQDYYNKIVNNVNKGVITDDTLGQLMMQCLTPYFEDKMSYEDAINILKSKIKIYINE